MRKRFAFLLTFIICAGLISFAVRADELMEDVFSADWSESAGEYVSDYADEYAYADDDGDVYAEDDGSGTDGEEYAGDSGYPEDGDYPEDDAYPEDMEDGGSDEWSGDWNQEEADSFPEEAVTVEEPEEEPDSFSEAVSAAEVPEEPVSSSEIPEEDPAQEEAALASDSASCGEGLFWTLEEGVLSVSGQGDMADYAEETEVPWYSQRDSVESAEIGTGVLSIGDHAFYGCANLKDVSIADTVTEIGQYAFCECTSLEEIALPVSVKVVAYRAFYHSGLRRITRAEGSPHPPVDEKISISEKAEVLISDPVYTGEALMPAVTVTLDGKELAEGTDFSVAYEENTDAGPARAVITGIGKYTGSVTAAFTISAKSLAAADVAGITDQVYTGTVYEPKPEVTLDGKPLVEGQDYYLAYKYNINASESEKKRATVAVKGKGNYTDTAVVRFWIRPASLAAAEVTGITDKTYTGKAYEPKPAVTLDGKALVEGQDYYLAYKYNINASESEAKRATVAVKGMGNYTGTAVVRFWIKPASLTNADITGIVSKVYTGSALTQLPGVKLGGKTLKLDTDYYLAYKNNINTGRATIAIKGKGNYSGVAVRYFSINPKPSWIASLSSPKTKQITVKWGKRTQISGYQLEISTKKDFSSSKMQKNVYDPAKLSMTVTVAKAGTTYYVRIRSFKKTSDKTYFSTWSAVKTIKTK